jgi:hypothetical protein
MLARAEVGADCVVADLGGGRRVVSNEAESRTLDLTPCLRAWPSLVQKHVRTAHGSFPKALRAGDSTTSSKSFLGTPDSISHGILAHTDRGQVATHADYSPVKDMGDSTGTPIVYSRVVQRVTTHAVGSLAREALHLVRHVFGNHGGRYGGCGAADDGRVRGDGQW